MARGPGGEALARQAGPTTRATAVRRSQDPQQFTEAVEGGLRMAILACAGIWLTLIAAALRAESAGLESWLLLSAAAGTWCAALFGGQGLLRVHVATLVVTAWLQGLLTEPLLLFVDVDPTVPWTLLAALCVGLHSPQRWAWRAVVGVTAGAAGAVSIVAIESSVLLQAWSQIATMAAFSLGDGMAAAAATAALRKAASASDRTTAALNAQRRVEASRRARRELHLQVQRVLHDTVVNTLGVVRRGFEPGREDALRERCLRDAQAASHLWTGPPETDLATPAAVVLSLRQWAQALGLRLEVSEEVTSPDLLPEEVARAVVAAGKEALRNISRHSGMHEALLRFRWSGRTLEVDVLDTGRGWSTLAVPGHGLEVAIRKPAMAAGMTVQFDSRPQGGAAVRLRWHASDGEPDLVSIDPGLAMARAAVQIGLWLTFAVAAMTALSWSMVPATSSLLALLVLASVIVVGWAASLGWIGIPAAPAVGAWLILATALVSLLPAHTARTCEQFGLAWWGGDGALAVLIVLLALTRAWGWTVAGAATLIGSVAVHLTGLSGLPTECRQIPLRLLLLELGFLAMVIIVRATLLRLWWTASSNLAAAHRQRLTNEIAAQQALASDARVDAVLATVSPILQGIAGGQLDPHAREVRSASARGEEALRSLLVIGPEPSGLSGLIADMVVLAIDRRITFSLTALPTDPVAAPEWLAEVITSIVDGSRGGSTMTVAVIADHHTATVLITCDRSARLAVADVEALMAGSVSAVDIAGETLIEIAWQL